MNNNKLNKSHPQLYNQAPTVKFQINAQISNKNSEKLNSQIQNYISEWLYNLGYSNTRLGTKYITLTIFYAFLSNINPRSLNLNKTIYPLLESKVQNSAYNIKSCISSATRKIKIPKEIQSILPIYIDFQNPKPKYIIIFILSKLSQKFQ